MAADEDFIFEFDDLKSQANLLKHGIDFAQGKRLWSDACVLIVPTDFPAEPRFLAIGVLDGGYWTAVFTWRLNRIRIISIRRSRDEEQKGYEEKKTNHDLS